MMIFRDRTEAATILAAALKDYVDEATVVMALPRGGIVLGAVIAESLGLPLGTALVRKIGHPNAPEYAIGAVAEGGTRIFNQQEIALTHRHWLDNAEKEAEDLMTRRRQLYYDHFLPPSVKGKNVILVDDGIATGLSMQAAVIAQRRLGAKKIIIAVPVAPWDTVKKLERLVDYLIIIDNPENFAGAVGAHYVSFDQVDDQTVKEMLEEVRTHGLQQKPA